MVLKREKLQELVDLKFNGNRSRFAKTIGIDRGQLSKILKDGTCAGKEFILGFYRYCKNEKMNFDSYFLFKNS